MLVGLVPNTTGHFARRVQVHAHPLFLTSLAGKDVGSRSLSNLGYSGQNVDARGDVDGRDVNELVAIGLTNVLEDYVEGRVWKDHGGKLDVVRNDALRSVFSSDLLDMTTSRGTREHAVGDGTCTPSAVCSEFHSKNGGA
jgi:hypothetical protein